MLFFLWVAAVGCCSETLKNFTKASRLSSIRMEVWTCVSIARTDFSPNSIGLQLTARRWLSRNTSSQWISCFEDFLNLSLSHLEIRMTISSLSSSSWEWPKKWTFKNTFLFKKINHSDCMLLMETSQYHPHYICTSQSGIPYRHTQRTHSGPRDSLNEYGLLHTWA